jgi:hypothetical protein
VTFLPANSKNSFLNETEVFPEDKSQFLIKLTNVYSNIAYSTNVKEIALYDTIEQVNGQQFYNTVDIRNRRSCYRKVYPFGAIATGATLNVAHGLTHVTMYTRIYGTAITDVVDYRPLPFVSIIAANAQISVIVTATTIVVVNGAASPNVTSGYIVLEYLKN